MGCQRRSPAGVEQGAVLQLDHRSADRVERATAALKHAPAGIERRDTAGSPIARLLGRIAAGSAVDENRGTQHRRTIPHGLSGENEVAPHPPFR
jgi:hypothetical protein